MIYNLKIKKFTNNKQQIVLYDYPIHENDKITELLSNKALLTKQIKSEKNIKKDDDSKLHSILNSKNRTVNKIYDLARANNWEWFITLTFNKQKVNRKNYDDVVRAMQLFIKTVKKHCSDFRYLIVPELHDDGISWHMHGLISNIDERFFIDSGKTTKDNDIIYNFISWDCGFSTATKIKNNDAAVRYMTKYITKELVIDTLYRNRYYCSQNLNKPDEKKYYLLKHEVSEFIIKLSDNLLYAKTLEFGDSNILYLDVENCSNLFDFYSNKCEFKDLD